MSATAINRRREDLTFMFHRDLNLVTGVIPTGLVNTCILGH